MSNLYSQAVEIECPLCGTRFNHYDAAAKEDSEIECPACEVTLVCTEVDIVKWWRWEQKDDVEAPHA
jgi:uncharacterized Zn-finger protein